MQLTQIPCQSEADFWRLRNFLRQVFLLNDRLEHSWNVARLDYWRWHIIQTCETCDPFEKVTVAWQALSGELAACLHPVETGEVRLHIHPAYRTPELENEAFACAEERFYTLSEDRRKYLVVPILQDDALRQAVLSRRGFQKYPGWGHHYWRDLDAPLPAPTAPPGYVIRSMGGLDEHPARCWASWRAFHPGEPDADYNGHDWYPNLQSAPLYRRDLDLVATTDRRISTDPEIAAFCTIYYDDYTRSAVTVVVGVAAEHWRRGLGKAVMLEGLHRLQALGCTRVFSTAHDEPADALYRSVLNHMRVTDTWLKVL